VLATSTMENRVATKKPRATPDAAVEERQAEIAVENTRTALQSTENALAEARAAALEALSPPLPLPSGWPGR
jgi:hypothetical protein